MNESESKKKPIPAIRDLYPSLNGEELKEAEENLSAYIEEAWESYQEICADPERRALFRALTSSKAPPTMKERSNKNQPEIGR